MKLCVQLLFASHARNYNSGSVNFCLSSTREVQHNDWLPSESVINVVLNGLIQPKACRASAAVQRVTTITSCVTRSVFLLTSKATKRPATTKQQ
ncbi:1-(5-phosphoribosyl)-5-[(5-phosphoribosylamino)methylideneamino] imidazole-4-carboxamide isomerase [Trichinella spiralis]|uniref:1-(5-phosphoribosyl)-5-[(5-phosphoribosylamino)methylideneamino] imidazole-4-carboxamide isomerase n=1 Tax=Trichinella spiralis TaxID=6334 RepID=A0ABR3KG39_TRISP